MFRLRSGPATPTRSALTTPAQGPTISAAPAPPPRPKTTAPAPPPPPETTPAPPRHSGTIQGGEFCSLSEEGWIGFDDAGDEYFCLDVNHDGHPHWVSPSAAPPQSDASTVVEGYFAAINARDYPTAWALGGRNLVGSYQDFVNGLAGTLQDTLSVVSVQGQSVRIELDAEQTDGSHRYYAGTYTVSGGVIVAADIKQR